MGDRCARWPMVWAAMAVAFLPGANEAQLRRLQLAAEQGGANGFALRPMRAAPAHLPLSISLNQANQQTTVKVHRGRGLPSRKQVVLS